MSGGELILGNRDQAWLAAALMAAGCFLVIRSLKGGRLQGGAKWAAAAAKLAVFAGVAFLLLEPQWVRELPRRGANDVALLADNSASLAIAAAPGATSPAAKMREALGGAEPPSWQRGLRDLFRLQRFSFDARLKDVADYSALEFKAPASAMIASLDALARRYEKRPLAGIVVLTDGNATDESSLVALTARKAPAPIYFVAMGGDKALPDIALGEVTVAQTAFEDSPVTVSARASVSGFGAEDLVFLVRDSAGKTVLTVKERPAAGQSSHLFHGRFRPSAKGVSFYTATVLRAATAGLVDRPEELRKASGEVTLENNSRVFAVDRKAGPYRVLYVSGRPNWEYKFLRRALAGDDEVKLTALIRIAKREPKFQWRGRAGEESNPLFRGFGNQSPEEALRYDKPVLVPLGVVEKTELAGGFPTSAEELFGTYRCVILDDVEAEFFSRAQLDLLERFVSLRGGSLVMLGGAESFQAGAWSHTPVARLLPVQVDGAVAEPPAEDAKLKLTREGWLEPWVRLRDSESEEEARVAKMTGFFTVNPAGGIKPGASVLATVTDPKRGEMPAWVVQRYGAGRSGAVLVGDLWRWALQNADAHQDFDKAWRQFVRHLVVDVPDRAEIQAVADPAARDRMKLQVHVRDSAFKAVEDATVRITVETPGGATSELAAEPSMAEAGLFEAEIATGAAGGYRAKALVKDADGKVVGEPATGWAANPQADETASLVNHRSLMDRLASWSGGAVLAPSELGSLADRLAEHRVPVTETRSDPLWHAPWVLVLLAGLLGIEWWLRRRFA